MIFLRILKNTMVPCLKNTIWYFFVSTCSISGSVLMRVWGNAAVVVFTYNFYLLSIRISFLLCSFCTDVAEPVGGAAAVIAVITFCGVGDGVCVIRWALDFCFILIEDGLFQLQSTPDYTPESHSLPLQHRNGRRNQHHHELWETRPNTGQTAHAAERNLHLNF